MKVDKVFNSVMTELFQGSHVEEILKNMFAHLKTQVEHPALPYLPVSLWITSCTWTLTSTSWS